MARDAICTWCGIPASEHKHSEIQCDVAPEPRDEAPRAQGDYVDEGIMRLVRERDALQERVRALEAVVQGLIAYGMIQPVEGVRYPGGSHAEYIERARALAGTGEGATG